MTFYFDDLLSARDADKSTQAQEEAIQESSSIPDTENVCDMVLQRNIVITKTPHQSDDLNDGELRYLYERRETSDSTIAATTRLSRASLKSRLLFIGIGILCLFIAQLAQKKIGAAQPRLRKLSFIAKEVPCKLACGSRVSPFPGIRPKGDSHDAHADQLVS
ncbi:hypothetical protein IWZ03DRAFT_361066 [Phyllosticta citriasiana]|uniref:Uncharacterized protein n=1 Tax=Phyllosticta citriasiana TaxID=595635 RepID=A0ABR1KIS2_9PEZI